MLAKINWDCSLGQIGVALRSSYHTSIGFSPYYVLFGQQMVTHGENYELWKKLDLLEEGSDVIDHSDKVTLIRKQVTENLEQVYQISKRNYNIRSRPNTFSEGEIVFRRNFAQSSKVLKVEN